MVCFNVSQLMLAAPGTVRVYDFDEPLPDPDDDLHLVGNVRGRARLTRTSEGILVHSQHRARARLECARCLDELTATLTGAFAEEFLPTTDVRTGLPVETPPDVDDELLRISDHHEIDLNEILRQNLLTSLPLQPLCDPACPGLCPTCGQRLDPTHSPHPESAEADEPASSSSPFAQLAALLHDEERT